MSSDNEVVEFKAEGSDQSLSGEACDGPDVGFPKVYMHEGRWRLQVRKLNGINPKDCTIVLEMPDGEEHTFAIGHAIGGT